MITVPHPRIARVGDRDHEPANAAGHLASSVLINGTLIGVGSGKPGCPAGSCERISCMIRLWGRTRRDSDRGLRPGGPLIWLAGRLLVSFLVPKTAGRCFDAHTGAGAAEGPASSGRPAQVSCELISVAGCRCPRR